ncbi:hypothetical protein PBN151_2323 [Paenibacillus sp. NAIST15-1]|nr:hypothetical protein PBN151_2323 [Paenibacillus sp. NAIST15-1]
MYAEMVGHDNDLAEDGADGTASSRFLQRKGARYFVRQGWNAVAVH